MRDYRDAKVMAHSLRSALTAKGVSASHSESLELIAKSFGFDNWNVLAARISESQAPAARPAPSARLAIERLMAAVEGMDPGARRVQAAEAFLRRWSDEELTELFQSMELFFAARRVWKERISDAPVANQP